MCFTFMLLELLLRAGSVWAESEMRSGEKRKFIELIRLVKDWSDGVARIALLVLRLHAGLLIESCPNTAERCLHVFVFLCPKLHDF